MLSNFLSHSHTEALVDKNFEEWHRGIPYFGFWAIMIEQPEALALISKAQEHLQHFFLPHYSRQPHITLNACGLMSPDHFSQTKLDLQISMLKAMSLKPFEISLSHIDSFTTAAYLKVSDSNRSLSKINEALSTISSDSKPAFYQPHITLGLYRKKYESKFVAEKIMKLGQIKPQALLVSEVQFCRYETANIQGPIEIIKAIKLEL